MKKSSTSKAHDLDHVFIVLGALIMIAALGYFLSTQFASDNEVKAAAAARISQ